MLVPAVILVDVLGVLFGVVKDNKTSVMLIVTDVTPVKTFPPTFDETKYPRELVCESTLVSVMLFSIRSESEVNLSDGYTSEANGKEVTPWILSSWVDALALCDEVVRPDNISCTEEPNVWMPIVSDRNDFFVVAWGDMEPADIIRVLVDEAGFEPSLEMVCVFVTTISVVVASRDICSICEAVCGKGYSRVVPLVTIHPVIVSGRTAELRQTVTVSVMA